MFTNNNFRGNINGKTINDFTKNLDYKIDRSDDRVRYIEDRFNSIDIGEKKVVVNGLEYDYKVQFYDEYFMELFAQTTDIPLDKDGLYEIDNDLVDYDTYICWCKENDIDPLEYVESTTPFDECEDYYDVDGNLIEKGEWKYTGQNTSNIKLVLNKSDSLYSESNIAKELERVGSYILNSPKYTVDGIEVKKRDEMHYKIYNNRTLFKRACQEYNLINNFAKCNSYSSQANNDNLEGEAFPLFQAHKQNFNKIKDIKFIGDSDCKKYPILECYYKLHMDLKEKIKDESISKHNRNKMSYLIRGVKDDLTDMKKLVIKPIVFKSPLMPTPSSHCKDIFIPYKHELLSLLQYKYEDIGDTDLICCVLDVINAIDKCKFTDKQQEILELWMKEYTVDDISKELDINHKQVNSMLNSVYNKVIKIYNEQYEDWIGLNFVKSEWKKCSKCGEYKLLKRFDKKGKQGHQSQCKFCRVS